MDLTARVTGAAEVAGMFATAAATAPALAGRAVQETAIDLEAVGKQLAPVRTGTLRRSITHDMTGPASAEVGPTVEHGAHQEYGTIHMPPQPFMRPAAGAVTPQFVERMEHVARSVLG